MESSKFHIATSDQEYDSTSEDINRYAELIGIDASCEKHLMWIAEKGLAADVPKPWQIWADENGKIYYFNPKTDERSWYHPLDKKFAALVIEERSKSLNSASSDYGFESKLSSLADAPPLSSSGKNSPLPLSRAKNDGGLSGKKIEFGRIENRRGTQLAPVRLNALKMPAAQTTKASGMSFMPKGATLSKNVRKVKEEASYGKQGEGLDYRQPPPDDSNESLNSDEGSKYSYEETDEEDRNNHGVEPYDMLDTSQLSPMHSADESPDALDINSLVQLGTKLPQRFDGNLKPESVENLSNKENSPALSLRKVSQVGQPSFLKPLSQTTKKKGANKGLKAAKKVSKVKYPIENEVDYDDKISSINDEQRIMMQQVQKEWLAMQDELEKQEKEKYEDMLKDSSKKLEEEEMKLRNENSEKLSKIKSELQKKIEEEEKAAEETLENLKAVNKERIVEEEKKLQKELEAVSESLKSEVKKMEEKNAAELAQKKREFEEAFKQEVENMKLVHDANKKDIEDAHASEISKLKESFLQEIAVIKNTHLQEVDEVKSKMSDSIPEKTGSEKGMQNLQVLIKEEMEKYQRLLKEKEEILKEINSEKDNLVELRKETEEAQAGISELQDEVEKIENDLDLLRSEKSGLISELNILKENINNEKSNLFNLEKKVKSSIDARCSKEFVEIGINTSNEVQCSKELKEIGISALLICDTACKAIQASVSCNDVCSQVESVLTQMSNAVCQTSVSIVQNVASKSCQTDSVQSTNGKNSIESNVGKEVLNVDENSENAPNVSRSNLDSRINVIEHQLRTLQENLSKLSTIQPAYSSQEFIQNHFTEVNAVPISENRNIPPVYSTDSSVPVGLFSSNIPKSSQGKCNCELGDTASCDVLQDVKNSVYRLNDILCMSFVPPLSSSSSYQVNQAVHNYSSPFDNFYTQLRNMQEKSRRTELKHKCENEAVKLTKGITNTIDPNAFESSGHKNSLKPSYHLMQSSLCSYNTPEDPLIRARSIVLKEQARAWKEQQLMNSSVPHIFSLNSSSELSQSSVTGFTTSQNVPSTEQAFLNFDMDPETDYNMWMTRLNALQLRIRSHKDINIF